MSDLAFEYDYFNFSAKTYDRALGKAEGEAKGKAEGKAEGLLVVLAARGIVVPDSLAERVRQTTDLDQLDTWLRAAGTANTLTDVLG